MFCVCAPPKSLSRVFCVSWALTLPSTLKVEANSDHLDPSTSTTTKENLLLATRVEIPLKNCSRFDRISTVATNVSTAVTNFPLVVPVAVNFSSPRIANSGNTKFWSRQSENTKIWSRPSDHKTTTSTRVVSYCLFHAFRWFYLLFYWTPQILCTEPFENCRNQCAAFPKKKTPKPLKSCRKIAQTAQILQENRSNRSNLAGKPLKPLKSCRKTAQTAQILQENRSNRSNLAGKPLKPLKSCRKTAQTAQILQENRSNRLNLAGKPLKLLKSCRKTAQTAQILQENRSNRSKLAGKTSQTAQILSGILISSKMQYFLKRTAFKKRKNVQLSSFMPKMTRRFVFYLFHWSLDSRVQPLHLFIVYWDQISK